MIIERMIIEFVRDTRLPTQMFALGENANRSYIRWLGCGRTRGLTVLAQPPTGKD